MVLLLLMVIYATPPLFFVVLLPFTAAAEGVVEMTACFNFYTNRCGDHAAVGVVMCDGFRATHHYHAQCR